MPSLVPPTFLCFSLSAAKSERLKQAKEEAESEVSAYKAEREAEFKRKMAEDSTSSEENMVRLNAESERAIAAIKESIAAKKEDVIQFLLNQVQTVKKV